MEGCMRTRYPSRLRVGGHIIARRGLIAMDEEARRRTDVL